MAPTTAPKVFWTASPTFLAIRVPPSSSKAASSNSATHELIRHLHTVKNHNKKTLKLIWVRDLPVGIPLLWKHASQTRTGARPQPLSGTGRVFEEQESQKPSPQARQWCLVSLCWNSSPHLLHFYNTQTVRMTLESTTRCNTCYNTIECKILEIDLLWVKSCFSMESDLSHVISPSLLLHLSNKCFSPKSNLCFEMLHYCKAATTVCRNHH